MEQQIFLEGLRLNFKLRGNDKSKLQSIVGEFRLLGKVNQITTKLKIMPKQWDSKRMRAIISPRYSQLTNRNNRIANERLSDIEKKFDANIEYLCNNNTELEDITSYLKQTINNRYSMKKKEPKTQPLLMELRKLANKKKPATARVYNTRIDNFRNFMNINGLSDDVSVLSYETIDKFKDYMLNRGGSTHANDTLKTIKRFIKQLPNYNYDNRIDNIIIDEISLHNYVALTIDEIKLIYDFTSVP